MSYFPNVEGLLGIASALPLIALGALLLFLRPRRPDLTYFALFAVAWGAQIATANAGRLTTDAALHDAFFRLSVLLLLPTILFLVYFASLHPHRTWLARGRGGLLLLVLLVLPGFVALVFFPTLVIAQTTDFNGRPLSLLGPAVIPLFFVPFFAGFYYALLVQFRHARARRPNVATLRARAVFLALALFVAYVSVREFLNWALPPPLSAAQPRPIQLGNAALFGAGAALVATLLLLLLLRPRTPGDVDNAMVAALLLPAATALAERALQNLSIDVETLSLWRIGAVALVVHAVAKYELFDLDLRLRRTAATALPFLAALLTLAVLLAVAFSDSSPWVVVGLAVVGLAGNAAAWGSRERLAALLLPQATADPAYLHHRKLEVYRAAVERLILEQQRADAEEPFLAQLRRSLGLDARDHARAEDAARSGLGTRGFPVGSPPRVEPGALVLGRYRIERLLGEGAHGRAYLAHDTRDDRPIVLKAVGTGVLGGRAARLLQREARLAASLRHPNVVTVHEVHEGPQEAFLVMEYADGGNLHGLLQRRGRLGPPEAAHVLDQILAGLEAAHRKGIVHRDLKPENVLLLRDATVKLADFGVAREVGRQATAGLTQGGAVGTLLYMSPEQVRGLDADARSDLYAAAVVFHQLLTGRFYLRVAGRDDFQIRQLILRGPPRLDLKDQPEWVAPFLSRGLAKDPARRFQTAAEMRKTLGSAAGLRSR